MYKLGYDNQEILPLAAIKMGDTWYAIVFASDSFEYSEAFTTTVVTILEPLPITVYLPIVSNNYTGILHDEFYEPNNHPIHAYGMLTSNSIYDAYPNDFEDWYTFILTETTSIDVIVKNYASVGQVLIYKDHIDKQKLPLMAYDARSLPNIQIPMHIPYSRLEDLSPGTYYVRIYTASNTSTTKLYQLQLDY